MARGKKKSRSTSTAKKALALAKKANRKELKYLDGVIGITSDQILNTGVTWFNFPLIATGSTVNNRIGNVIHPTSLKLKYTMEKHASATATQVRLILLQQKNDYTGSITDYLQTADINSQKSVDHRYDSKTLLDKSFILDAERPKRFINMSIKVPLSMYYDASSSTPDKNRLVLYLISDEGTNYPTIVGNQRLYFTE